MTQPKKLTVDPELADLAARNERHRRRFKAREPKAAANVMAQLMAKRGYAARRTNEQLTAAWKRAAGEPLAKFSRAVGIRRGKVEVVVANSLMLQEIDFERRRIVDALVKELPDASIADLKLQVGTLPK